MEFEFENELMTECQAEFNKLAPEKSIYMTHYELANSTAIKSASAWKAFLMEPRVSDWVASELEMLRQSQLRKVISNAGNESRSVGAAQMINALAKVSETTQQKEGNIFIYCYTPLNERERTAPNTIEIGGQ